MHVSSRNMFPTTFRCFVPMIADHDLMNKGFGPMIADRDLVKKI
jgi:hypothetical protein